MFDVLHHLFLTSNGVYCLCFNMEWLLPSAPKAETERSLKYLRNWLNALVLHTLKYDEGKDIKTCAPFVLIGTRKDKVSDKRHTRRFRPCWTRSLEDA